MTLPGCLPARLRTARHLPEIAACLAALPPVCRRFPFFLELTLDRPPVAGLTLSFPVRPHPRRGRLLDALAAAGSPLRDWSGYLRKVARARRSLIPLRLYAALEEFGPAGGASADFLIATYDGLRAAPGRDRARARACFRLFASPEFRLDPRDLDAALDACGDAAIEHIGAGVRAGRTVLKLYALGPFVAILDALAPAAATPLFAANRKLLADLLRRTRGTVASVPLDFVDGRLVRLGVELKLRRSQVPVGPRERAATLGALPEPLRRRLRPLLRPGGLPCLLAGEPFRCGLNHLKVSFDTTGKPRWKVYVTVERAADVRCLGDSP